MNLLYAAAPGIGVILFTGGVVTGLLFGMFVLPGGRRAKRLTEELDALKKEHGDYRGQVTDHFKKTSELVGNMTRSYKEVYDHLAGGASALCEPPDAGNAVAFRAPRLIEIDDRGEPVGAEPDGEPDTESEATAAFSSRSCIKSSPSDQAEKGTTEGNS